MTAQEHDDDCRVGLNVLRSPWELERDETSSGPAFTVYDCDGRRITEPYLDTKKALLIAAAPELLAASVAVVKARKDFEQWVRGGRAGRAILVLAGAESQRDLRTRTEAAFASLAAAIAKAIPSKEP